MRRNDTILTLSMSKTIVITGIGILSPIGIGKDAYWNALAQGKTGFKKISLFDTSRFNVHVAGEIDFDPIQFLGKKGLRDMDRSIKLVNSAAKLAIDNSKLEITEDNTHSIGVSIGATFGSLHSISQFDRVGLIEGPRNVNPSHFPNTVLNSPASQISIRFNIKGFNTTISTGFCAGLDAVYYAADFIKLNRADVILTGAVEELCEETFLIFHNIGYLSGSDASEPICCPFDKRRNGFILSEGAAVLVVEDKEHAMKRGANILATVLGYGNSFDPSNNRGFSPVGAGLNNAISTALKEASLVPKDIDYICSCANSTKDMDKMETHVIKDIFGEDAYQVPVSSIKSMVGESYSASGSLALAAAVGTIQKGFIPPTVNYKEKDPECNLDYVPNKSRDKRVNKVLVTSADPYGQNTAIVVGKYGG